SREVGLPQTGILSRLRDAMRTAPRGAVGWRLCPAKRDRQSSLMAWILLAARAAVSHVRGPTYTPLTSPMATGAGADWALWRPCARSSLTQSSAPHAALSLAALGAQTRLWPRIAPPGLIMVWTLAEVSPWRMGRSPLSTSCAPRCSGGRPNISAVVI